MTTQGDSRPISGRADHGQGPGNSGERNRSRRVLTWCAVVLALGSGGWLISRPDPGDWLPGLGPSSKDSQQPLVLGNPPPTSSTDPNPFTVERYFPAARQIDLNGYKAKRSGARQGNDCSEVLQDPTKNVFQSSGCQGYLTVTFTRLDNQVLTDVTILRFGDDTTGGRIAAVMADQPALLRFVLPDATIAIPSPAAGSANGSVSKAEAVHHYVTVTTSRYVEGHGATASSDPDLTQATRAASYTAGAAFMWG